MKVQGSCHCGEVTYDAEVDPDKVSLCNCTDCQMLTGSAFRVSVPAPAATFRLLTGQPKAYVKTAASGAKRRHSFCPNCGTPVCATADTDESTELFLASGLLEATCTVATQETHMVQVGAGLGAERKRRAGR